MEKRIQRSMLILPANVPLFVEKAYLRGADAIVLDLEDSVPPGEKANARSGLKEAIKLAGRGGAGVLVRVNNDPLLIAEDLIAAVQPGLHAIFLPKADAPQDVEKLEAQISQLELDRALEPGSIRVSLHIESPRGVLNAEQTVAAGTRIESMSIGVDDYCLQLGVEPSADGMELFYAFCAVITVAKAAGVAPIGLMGSVGGFRDLEGFRRLAENSASMGCEGAFCIHPDQVEILNKAFSPPAEKIALSQRIVDAFEEAMKQGRASINLEGRMVDTPVYKQARLVLERSEAIARLEHRKTEALKRATSNG
jgi:citrate lyase subunit beta/citryl-CoA lyase